MFLYSTLRFSPVALFTALTLALGSCAASSSGGRYDDDERGYYDISGPRLSLLIGQRSLDEDDYEPLEDQPMFGLEFSDGGDDGLVGFEIGVSGSGDSEDLDIGLGAPREVEATVGEIYLGIRKEFEGRAVNPFIAVGFSMARLDIDTEGFGSVDDTSYGGYVHGGLLFPITSSFSIVADVRARFGEDYVIQGISGSADFVAVGVGLSFGL